MIHVGGRSIKGFRPASRVTDPDFASVVLLLHCDGTDGSTTFTDVKAHTMTASGTAQIDTAQSVFGGASGYFGTGAASGYVSAAASADWNFGAGDWTIEGRIRFETLGVDAQYTLVSNYSAANNDSWLVMLHTFTSSGLLITKSDGSVTEKFAWSPVVDTWYAWRIVKGGGNINMLINGVSIGSFADVGNWGVSTAALIIGREFTRNNDSQLFGWQDEIRITKGVGRDAAGVYTIATAAFPDA